MKLSKIATTIITITLVTLLIGIRQANALIAVIDAENLANSAKQVTSWKQQLESMKGQLEQSKQQYKALTSNRGLGKILYAPELHNNLPAEYKTVYNNIGSSNYGIAGSVTDIAGAEKLTCSIPDMQKSIYERSMRTAATNKAIGLKGYEGTHRRMSNIDALMDKINDTQDPKAISELQARIDIEQALIQN